MKVRCEYCKNYIDDSEERCSNCGAVNKDYKRTANQVPTTIDELKKWYEDHHLPPAETTRFFIGVDYKEPRAFGIYKDSYTGKFVVYKNKDDGSRAVRYECDSVGTRLNFDVMSRMVSASRMCGSAEDMECVFEVVKYTAEKILSNVE